MPRLGLRLLLLFLLATLGVGCAAAQGTSAEAAGRPTRDESTTSQAETPRAKPTGERPRRAGPTAVIRQDTADAPGVDRERYAQARWAPGQLEAHFQRHGREGPYRGAEEYDAAARETVRRGTPFTYVDRESNASRIGFYDQSSNRFTGLTRDGARITTHFRPDRGEAYIRGLERSTYR